MISSREARNLANRVGENGDAAIPGTPPTLPPPRPLPRPVPRPRPTPNPRCHSPLPGDLF